MAGLKELHAIGFVHRDLKPENIVLNIDRPLSVALIDFDRSLPVSNTCKTGVRGTPGYQPDNSTWFDGDIMWDIYSLACIVVECDMAKDEYIRAKDERGAKGIIKKHLENKSTCEHLFSFVDKLILNYRGIENPSLDEVTEVLKMIKFRPLK